MDFFKKIEFYLSEDECKAINNHRISIENKFDLTDGVQIIQRDLEPNEEMNDSYFIQE